MTSVPEDFSLKHKSKMVAEMAGKTSEWSRGSSWTRISAAQSCTELNVSAAGDFVVFSNFSAVVSTENILSVF